MMTDETNTVDELMSRDPLSLTTDDISAIIAYHRKARASAVPGKRTKREAGPKLDITDVMADLVAKPAPVTGIRRR